MKYLFLIFSLVFIQTTQSSAQEVREVKITKAYIPTGFDNNDNTILMIEGYLPSTCYKLGLLEQKVSGNNIELKQNVYFFDGPCAALVTKFEQTVFLGILNTGNYKVMDVSENSVLGPLPVQEAVNKVKPDDYDYANITDVEVNVQNNVPVATLRGWLPNNCWVFSENRTALEGQDVVTILPIIEQVKDKVCLEATVPFTTHVELSDTPKRKYLLQVRSLNGKAITKIVYPKIEGYVPSAR